MIKTGTIKYKLLFILPVLSIQLFSQADKVDSRFYLYELEKICLADSATAIKLAGKKNYKLVERSDYFLFTHQNTSTTVYSDASLFLWRQYQPQNRGLGADHPWQILYSYPDIIHSAALQTSILRSKKYRETISKKTTPKNGVYTTTYENNQFIIELDVANEETYKDPLAVGSKSFVFKIKQK